MHYAVKHFHHVLTTRKLLYVTTNYFYPIAADVMLAAVCVGVHLETLSTYSLTHLHGQG